MAKNERKEKIMGKKYYRVMYGIGRAKYVVNFHDGKKKHRDGSSFYDIKLFKNKEKLNKFIATLRKKEYTEK